jgi:hypothetical protein
MNINFLCSYLSVLFALFGGEEEVGKFRLGPKYGHCSTIVPKSLTHYCKATIVRTICFKINCYNFEQRICL